MPAAIVTIDRVSKRFAATGPAAIAPLATTIKAGQVTGLVGADGAGKSTLIRLIAALLTPTQGQITVSGLDTVKDTAEVHEAIGYMPQRFGLYEDLSVLENLVLYADLKCVVERRKEIFERLLAFTDLTRFTDRLAGKLSGGMKQKLGLACAMLKSPRLLLLDEPSVGVDPISRRELWRMVYELVDQGVGVLWSTSYLDEAEKCAEVIVLDEGKLLFEGDPKTMIGTMSGRVFSVRGASDERRKLLSAALSKPEVIDGVMQGGALRLVVAKGAKVPDITTLDGGHGVTVAPAAPRFEDAFIALLGGQPKRELVLTGGELSPATDGVAPVEASSLTRRFGAFTAADNISFKIKRGEIFGLLGPNGAGKSTTFKMMCGLLRPTSGTAHVDGLDLYSAPAAARARLGYMAQKFSLYGDLSVRQNLEFFAGAYGLSGEAKRSAVDRVVAAFNLTAYLSTNAGGLPLGFKQRLALAAAIMHEPPVLFLDEPTSGVDPLTRREFWSFINTMVGRGVTVMVTTHFLDEAEYCDRIALINRGKCIAIDTPEALQARVRSDALPEPTLEDAFIALVEEQNKAEA